MTILTIGMTMTMTILPVVMIITVTHTEITDISMTISITMTMIVTLTDNHLYDDLVLVDVGMQHMAKKDVGPSKLRGSTRARGAEKPDRQRAR